MLYSPYWAIWVKASKNTYTFATQVSIYGSQKFGVIPTKTPHFWNQIQNPAKPMSGSPARRSTRDIFIKDVGRPGRWFPETGCILELQIVKLTCSTSYDLALHFVGKITQCIGTRLSALHSTFHLFKEVSQNCFVFDVVNFKNGGIYAELLRF